MVFLHNGSEHIMHPYLANTQAAKNLVLNSRPKLAHVKIRAFSRAYQGLAGAMRGYVGFSRALLPTTDNSTAGELTETIQALLPTID